MNVQRALRERAVFLRSFLAHPRRVGAVLPTSRRAVNDMLDMTSFAGARLVVEFGAGTGTHTEEIAKRLEPGARLLAFEIEPALAEALAARVRDPQVEIVNDSAEHVERYLDGRQADVVVSAIPFTSLPLGPRRAILDTARRVLAPDGVMLVLQYSPFIQSELQRAFGSVRRRISPLNVPPAMLFRCPAEPAAAARARA